MIPLGIPEVGDEKNAAAAEVLRSGRLVHGPVGSAFEREFAAYVGARIHFDPPVHLHEFYRRREAPRHPLPVTEVVAQRVVTLPMYPKLTERELDEMVTVVKDTLVAVRS